LLFFVKFFSEPSVRPSGASAEAKSISGTPLFSSAIHIFACLLDEAEQRKEKSG
jgi:hypothetical protein